jgi:putative chitinase
MAAQSLITSALLRAVAPKLAPAVAETYALTLAAAAEIYEINTPPRVAAFVAQLAHESGGFRYLSEIWGPTAQQRRYDPARPGQARNKLAERLGNTEQGDGSLFRGRGWIQLTGRANYAAASKALGLDLVSNPRLAQSPAIAARIAGWFWQSRRLNELADNVGLLAFNEITRRINGGTNGAAERRRLFFDALAALGIDPLRVI